MKKRKCQESNLGRGGEIYEQATAQLVWEETETTERGVQRSAEGGNEIFDAGLKAHGKVCRDSLCSCGKDLWLKNIQAKMLWTANSGQPLLSLLVIPSEVCLEDINKISRFTWRVFSHAEHIHAISPDLQTWCVPFIHQGKWQIFAYNFKIPRLRGLAAVLCFVSLEYLWVLECCPDIIHNLKTISLALRNGGSIK